MRFKKSVVTMLVAFALTEGLFLTAAIQAARAEDVLDRKLRTTHMRTNVFARNANCAQPRCIASLSAFDPPELIVPCTGGKRSQVGGVPHCTFKLSFCGVFLFLDNTIEGDAPFIRFRVDGENPIPGPTGPGGIVFVNAPVPPGAPLEAHCFSVVSTGKALGDHTIEVDFGALNIVGGETSVWLREAELSIEVYNP